MFRDNDISASRNAKKARPGWEDAERVIYEGNLNILILWDTGRAWRKLIGWLRLVDACRDNDVLIHVISHHRTYDPRIRRDRKTLIEEGVDAEDETEKLAERVKRAFDANREQGKPHSRPPYGYEIQIDPENPRRTIRVPVPEKAAIAAEVITRVAKSESLTSIKKDLIRRRVPTYNAAEGLIDPRSNGKEPQWSTQMLRKICLNKAYIGKRAYIDNDGREIVVDATWPAIIDEETFYTTYNLLKDPKRITTRPGKGKYLLAFFAKCDVCESPISRMSGKADPMRYRCHDKSCVTIRMDWVDDFIAHLVCERLARPDAFDAIAKPKEETANLEAELARLNAEHNEALELRKKGKLSLLALSQEEERLLPQIHEIERKLQPAPLPQVITDLRKDALGNKVLILTRWLQLDVPARKDVVRTLFESIRIRKTNAIGRVSKEEDIAAMLKYRVRVKWRKE